MFFRPFAKTPACFPNVKAITVVTWYLVHTFTSVFCTAFVLWAYQNLSECLKVLHGGTYSIFPENSIHCLRWAFDIWNIHWLFVQSVRLLWRFFLCLLLHSLLSTISHNFVKSLFGVATSFQGGSYMSAATNWSSTDETRFIFLSIRVLTTLSLCCIRWCDWKFKYWFVCVFFLYRVHLKFDFPLSLVVINKSRNGMDPLTSSSTVDFMLLVLSMEFRWLLSLFTYPFFIASSTFTCLLVVANFIVWQGYCHMTTCLMNFADGKQTVTNK